MMLIPTLEFTLLLICIWGLLALIITGQFSSIVIIGCILAICVAYRVRKKGWIPSLWATNILAGLVMFISAVLFFTTYNLLTTTVYLFILLQVTKYVTRRTLTDIRWCYLISLFHVVGASVITTTLTFGVVLVVYIFLLLISLRLYMVARGWENSADYFPRRRVAGNSDFQVISGSVAPRSPAPPVPSGLIWSALPMVIIMMALSGLLFSVIPRLASQSLFQAYGDTPEEPATSAFSESVEFGAFTEIQQDNAVAMYVTPSDSARLYNVRMRAVALDNFDGKTWKRTNFVSIRSGIYEFRPPFTRRHYQNSVKLRILQPPKVTNFLFGDSFPQIIRVPAPFSFNVDPLAQAAYLPDMLPKEIQYEVESTHEALEERQDPTSLDRTQFLPTRDLFSFGRDYTYAVNARQSNPENRFERMALRIFNEVESWTAKPESPSANENRPARRREQSDDGAHRIQRPPRPEQPESLDRPPPPPPPDRQDFINDPSMRDFSNRFQDNNRPRSNREILFNYLEKCLEVPESLATGKVPELAREWTSDAHTTFAKAMAIENTLRTEFSYSLKQRATGNFIESFLTDVREGHCEYFATGMVMLLRNLGIPARIVNGYYGTEWNSLSGNFTIRQRDAHSWVEAWLGNDYGWMTFDPTPPSGVGRRSEQSMILAEISRLMDAVKVRWYRYVVDYSFNDQVGAFHKVMEWRRTALQWLNDMRIPGFGGKERRSLEIGSFSTEIDWRPVGAAGAIVLTLAAWQLLRWKRNQRRNRISSIRFYNELLIMLAKSGLRIQPGQTPREFARQVAAHHNDLSDFVPLTESYYARKYLGADISPDDMQRAGHIKKILRQVLKRSRRR